MHPEDPEPKKETNHMRIQTTPVFTALIVAMTIVPGFAVLSIALASSALAQAESVIVNVENFVRAETAAQFDRIVENAGGVNRFFTCADRRRWTSRPSSA
jgi:hypothetical protein